MKLIISIFGLFLSSCLLAQTKDCWPSFRGGQQLQGVTADRLPAQPRLLWTFQAEDDIKASPVVCNGILVVGSVNGCLYGVNMEGKQLWSLQTENAIEAPALIFEATVFVGNMDGTLLALDLYTGRELSIKVIRYRVKRSQVTACKGSPVTALLARPVRDRRQ